MKTAILTHLCGIMTENIFESRYFNIFVLTCIEIIVYQIKNLYQKQTNIQNVMFLLAHIFVLCV